MEKIKHNPSCLNAICEGCIKEEINETGWRGELNHKLTEREGKMFYYYKSVFEDGWDGGYPASYDEEIEAFIKSNFIEREALVKLVEGMKKTEYVDGIFANGAGEYNIVTGYNQFAEDLLKEINK